MDEFDLLIIGGGINGAAIARDAALRGARLLLVEKDDLAAHTSSASSKLIHGGLRYLEQGELRLVREALNEREILLKTAPHMVTPLRFVLPHAKAMRPRWMLRAGLLLYDLFSVRGRLPRSSSVGKADDAVRLPLSRRTALLAYWDAWVDDSRLVTLNAVQAAEHGAEIATRTEFVTARRSERQWLCRLANGREVEAKAIVNAAGPWVLEAIGRTAPSARDGLRLVKGSHIVLPALWPGNHAYILQQPDRRIVFALPFHDRFTLIGTTDIPVDNPGDAAIGVEETRYLCEAVGRYFRSQPRPDEVVWSFSGVRALHDDGASNPSAVTRDYHLALDCNGAPLLSVFGGKVTTARALAEQALDRLGIAGACRTKYLALPGGDLSPAYRDWCAALSSWMPQSMIARMSRAYGTRLRRIIGDAGSLDALGSHFGSGLYEAELAYLRDCEFARTGEDVLWRRTKLGLDLTESERAAVEGWMALNA